MLLSVKIDYRARKIARDKEGHYLMIRVNSQRCNSLLDFCLSESFEIHKAKSVKPRGKMEKSTIFDRSFNTPCLIINRPSKLNMS